jgi:hypothetical protein
VEIHRVGQKAGAERPNRASKWSKINLLLPELLLFDYQGSVFFT